MVLYPNKLPESERVCSGICKQTTNQRLTIKIVTKINRLFSVTI